ncbi:hypothetical protein RJ639_002263 [Escallonia herrerae]|uniref:Xylanase inhibitor C-terminal domain-containing protein n=1 Tax=Escallonia herrerae TaxID=1293975 RepID=A0AA89BGX8_9ASTE|nr:hypothetical protein RJ639_002263 [Escallonia herrerae]
MASLGGIRISLSSQFSASFSFSRKFTVCLTSGRNASAAGVLFGDGPYVFLPDIDASSPLTYTPLFINPKIGGVASSDYFIGVKSVKVNEKIIPINAKLLSINNTDGYGGTKINTVNPNTVLENEAFINELKIIPHLQILEGLGRKKMGKVMGKRERPDRSLSKKFAPISRNSWREDDGKAVKCRLMGTCKKHATR